MYVGILFTAGDVKIHYVADLVNLVKIYFKNRGWIISTT